ncbi:MAG: tRNA (guanosine(46)-N7)-methyltransferase TrmB [Planctomycetes bacterium]|nr:tRNA (guanosine(46)-N7)-methyltransferase TrmB [Planctomycetota bacterium]
MAQKPKRRVRHHVNPLSFRRPVELPDWSTAFANPELPLEVDVGCMHGTFMLERARRVPEHNFVGLEIRVPLVEEVRQRIERDALPNARVVLCNANTSFTDLFAPQSVHRVYVHFPDPWFKAKHHKRRLVKPEFLDAVASRLTPDGELQFATDYKDYAEEVLDLVEAHPRYTNRFGPRAPAQPDPERVLTNREAWHLSLGDPVYRYHWGLAPG